MQAVRLREQIEHVEDRQRLAFPFYFGELVVVLWLAFIGAKPRTAEA
jgi:hypothetical protein